MTKGDRDKLRAELAGKAMAAIIAKFPAFVFEEGSLESIKHRARTARGAVRYADALMAELGIKGEE